jgi:hypothetical protein
VDQVPDSLRMEGYSIEALEDCGNYCLLRVRRP